MKVLVPVKRVIDYNVRVRVKADGTDVDRSNVKMSMNPFDEIAVEEAVRLKEQGIATEVVAVSIGAAEAAETLRTALAMGADRAILVKTAERIEPLAAAKILQALCKAENPRLVLTGKQAIDDDACQTGAMLAALQGWAQASFAHHLELSDHTAQVGCETDSGSQTLEVRLPAVVSVDLRLNQPRYASLPNIVKARKKPLTETTPEELGVAAAPRLKIVAMREPEPRTPAVMVGNVGALLDRLKDAGAL